jgi:hypothetical protein
MGSSVRVLWGAYKDPLRLLIVSPIYEARRGISVRAEEKDLRSVQTYRLLARMRQSLLPLAEASEGKAQHLPETTHLCPHC